MRVARDAPKRPALRYYGGKWRLAPWIISFFPEHQNYVEPCGGAASVLLQKPRSPLETYNDLDGNVVNFFRVLRDRPEELIRKIRLTPWARAEYELARDFISDGSKIERARRFYVASAQSIHGGPDPYVRKSGWKIQKADGKNGHYDYGENLEQVANRFKFVQVEQRDALEVIARFDNWDTLHYLDPPYIPETRTHDTDGYRLEVTQDWHDRLAALLHQCQGYVVISGYACPLYTELYEAHGWQRHDKVAQTNSGGKRVESVWLSPRTVEALSRPRQVTMFERNELCNT